MAVILKNKNGQKIFYLTVHWRRIRAELQEECLRAFEAHVKKLKVRNAVQALLICGDFNAAPEVLEKCFNADIYDQQIESAELITTKRGHSLDNANISKYDI